MSCRCELILLVEDGRRERGRKLGTFIVYPIPLALAIRWSGGTIEIIGRANEGRGRSVPPSIRRIFD